MNSYILCMEIGVVEVNKVYDRLPPHCTLMLWFLSSMAVSSLVDDLDSLISHYPLVDLTLGDAATFGPPDVIVNHVVLTSELRSLHSEVYQYLTSQGATFNKPEYVGEGYNPHITHQEGFEPRSGDSFSCSSVYLAQADEEHNGPRTIVGKFLLKSS